MAGCATQPPEPGLTIPVAVSKPDGAGPFPAIVMLHDCSGLGPNSSGAPRRWATLLVDPKRIAVMDGSHGGTTTMLAMARPGFRAGVALYPRCSSAPLAYRPSAPLLVLIGELDDWTPAADCTRLAHEVTLKVYPGAHHAFDSERPVRFIAARINPSSPSGRGATTGGNAGAWSDAIEEATRFLDRSLSRS